MPSQTAAMRFLDGPRGDPDTHHAWVTRLHMRSPHSSTLRSSRWVASCSGWAMPHPSYSSDSPLTRKEPRTFAQHPMGAYKSCRARGRPPPPDRIGGSTRDRDLTLGPRGRVGPVLLEGALPQDLGRHPGRGTRLLPAAPLTARAMQGAL